MLPHMGVHNLSKVRESQWWCFILHRRILEKFFFLPCMRSEDEIAGNL
jgi:hypothetical protein